MSMHRSRRLHARLGGRAKRLAAAGSAASCLVLALGPGGGVSFASSVRSAAKSTFVIGSVLNDLTNPFQATMGKAEQAEASKLGVTIHVVSGNVNGSISISQQVAEVQQFISRKVNMILVTPSDPSAIVPVIKKANAAGIPVMAVNTEVGKGAKVVTFVGDNDYQYGVDEGKLVAQALHGKGNVALLLGVLGDSPEVLRTEGIKATLKHYPGIHIVTSLVDNWVNSTNIADVQDLLTKYHGTSLNAVVAEGPEMYAGAEYARSHGNTSIKFIAGDYSTEVRTAIQKGDVYGTVDQSPQTEGLLAVKFAVDWLSGKKSLVKSPADYIPLPLVTQANVAKYPATWSS
ncbi:MAG: sugar ABC transporter substrate-binding protein [Acidimicrobiales bacterium]